MGHASICQGLRMASRHVSVCLSIFGRGGRDRTDMNLPGLLIQSQGCCQLHYAPSDSSWTRRQESNPRLNVRSVLFCPLKYGEMVNVYLVRNPRIELGLQRSKRHWLPHASVPDKVHIGGSGGTVALPIHPWRKRWESNPRTAFRAVASLAKKCNRPLCHASIFFTC